MSNKRKKYSDESRAKVALAALRNEQTIFELFQRFGAHPNMISSWKKALEDNAADTFDKSYKFRKNWMIKSMKTTTDRPAQGRKRFFIIWRYRMYILF
jgi:transposase